MVRSKKADKLRKRKTRQKMSEEKKLAERKLDNEHKKKLFNNMSNEEKEEMRLKWKKEKELLHKIPIKKEQRIQYMSKYLENEENQEKNRKRAKEYYQQDENRERNKKRSKTNYEKEDDKNIKKQKMRDFTKKYYQDDEQYRTTQKSRSIAFYQSLSTSTKKKLAATKRGIYYRKLYENYNKIVQLGATNICSSCGGLWFLRQTSKLNKNTIAAKYSTEFANKCFYLNTEQSNETNEFIFCSTCRTNINNGKIPNICLTHGLDFPQIDNCIKNLTPVEERLVSPRIPFMQIRRLGYEKQYGIKGGVVNVPISVDTTTKTLPRNLNDTYTIMVHIKKRLVYKTDVYVETIRPAVVWKALKKLMESPLYRLLNIKLSTTWEKDNNLDVNSEEHQPFISSEEDLEILNEIFKNNDKTDQEETNNKSENQKKKQ